MIRTSGDFADERDRMSNKTRWFNFRKAVWGPIHKYMNDQINVICSNVSREMVGALGESFAQFGNVMGSRTSSLKGAQLGIISGVGNMAQSVESMITENEERKNKQEQVSTSMYSKLRKIMQVSTKGRGEAQNGMVEIGRKSSVSRGNIKSDALTSANGPIQNRAEKERYGNGDSRVRRNRPEMPYHFFRGGWVGGGGGLEQPSTCSSFTSMFSPGWGYSKIWRLWKIPEGGGNRPRK